MQRALIDYLALDGVAKVSVVKGLFSRRRTDCEHMFV
jgi:hypothetical protein